MSGYILGIDPGNRETAYALIHADTRRPKSIGKYRNGTLRGLVSGHLRARRSPIKVAIELVGHYGTGMPAGQDVFDTCREIGRLEQICEDHGVTPVLVKRATVKAHHCGTAKGTDATVRQALVDRFAPGAPNHGKGTKADPGWFYGFRADVWQAYALAVYVADTINRKDNPGRG